MGQVVRIRQAAVVWASLPPSEAAELAARMSPAQRAALYSELARLAPIQAGELREATHELFQQLHARHVPPTGESLDLPTTATGNRDAVERMFDPTRQGSDTPFQFLENREPDEIAQRLECERPQIAAVVLTQLSRRKANQVLVRLSPEMQLETTRCQAELEPITREILEELAHSLRLAWCAARVPEPAGMAPGFTK
jgi:flagellar motor switch protein FliG